MMTANDKKRNKGWARLALCFIIGLGTLPLAAEGKLTLSPYLDYSYSNNIFWNSSSIGDTTVSPGLGLGFTTPSFNFFLNADGKIYRNNAQMNSSMFSGGFSFYQMLSRRSSLFFSPELSLIQFQGDMAAMNTLIPGLTVGLKHMFSDHLFGRLGLNLRHSNYLNEDSYDRLRLGAFWEISTFFRTQTTIRLTLGVNYLLFPHITTMLAAVTGPVAPLAVTTASAASSDHSRRGNPNPAPPVPPSPPLPPVPPTPPAPPAPPGEPAPEPETQTPLVPTTIDLAIPQPYIALRIAQGIGFKTGLIAEFLFRKNQRSLQGVEALSAAEWALEQIDEDFFWEGTRLTLGIKTEALLGLELSVNVSASAKRYQGIAALDLDGNPILPEAFRSDTLAQVNAVASKSFGRLGVSLSGGYRKNDSNDPYFRYDFVAFTFSIGYSF